MTINFPFRQHTRSDATTAISLSSASALALLGSILCILFQFDVLVPFQLGIAAFTVVTAAIFTRCRSSRLALLSKLMLALFALPFSNLLGYIVFEDFDWWESPAAVLLSADTAILDTMVHLGLIGLCGLGAGMTSVQAVRAREPSKAQVDPLPLPVFYLILILGLALCYISTPEETIFDGAYASLLSSLAESVNFNGAGLVGFTLLAALAIDIERLRGTSAPLALRILPLIVAVLIVVVVFQTLRGDRESIGLIAALMGIYLTSPDVRGRGGSKSDSSARRRLVATSGVATVVVVGFVALGSLRYTISNGDQGSLAEEIALGYKQNTWSAVLLNNLGSAAQYQRNELELLWGETYLDYLLSIPPGVITSYLGYQRPLELDTGPNWWFQGISTGGMHILVVPFHNFGAFGILVLLALYGRLIGIIDRNCLQHFWPRLFYAGFLTFSFQWFWYGDMNLIRGVMSVALAGILCRFGALVLNSTSARVASHAPPLSGPYGEAWN